MINFYQKIPKHLLDNTHNPNFDLHGIKIPFRMIVVAPSGTGKTNFVLNLIGLFSKIRSKPNKKKNKKTKMLEQLGIYEEDDDQGTFKDIHIITRNKDEPLYNFLASKSSSIIISEGLESIPDLDKFDKKDNHLVVFDDLVLEKNLKPISEYYIRARKLNVSVIFLSQSYFGIPKTIRINSNYIVILKLSGAKDIKLILSEFSLGIDKETLVGMYNYATNQPMDAFIIETLASPDRMFRKNFTDYLSPF